ncbi:hypothetical protein PFISCL1PPCAC_6218 [Pristionchus fissidentatus]|uniref:Uncharacterized protein n=1 Tax=Pristionchus fissidentatus TaxID=1538716 RepID=A0AAV5V6C1_9BILA|nr:hypothetical protein PFISCL1PPCAC_6218 [Pristionchus fissidentatus]
MTRYLLFLLFPLVSSSILIWPNPQDLPPSLKPKPKDWSEKNMGQWCRNLTTDRHTQCSLGSIAHRYDCCGDDGSECCFVMQGWVPFVLVGLIITFISSISFYFLLHFRLICLERTYPPPGIYIK